MIMFFNPQQTSDGKFICSQCEKAYNSMWGNVCNPCRTEEKRSKEVNNSLDRMISLLDEMSDIVDKHEKDHKEGDRL